MINIWFEPHSTTVDNEAKRASGWNDVDLSEKGVQQADELAERNTDRNLAAIFCSDLQRAVKSAVPSSDQLHIPIYVDKRLRECDYGSFTQQPSDVVAAKKLNRISKPFPEGESYEQVMLRMKSFLDWLKQAGFEGKTVLIIGHRATHWGLDHWLKGQPLTECVEEQFTWQPGWQYELGDIYAARN
jgi:alpha-ribazole phosphatase/probable phosphoglycerate mutase